MFAVQYPEMNVIIQLVEGFPDNQKRIFLVVGDKIFNVFEHKRFGSLMLNDAGNIEEISIFM